MLANQQGQSSDVFRLLIGAIMGLAILAIVLGIVQVVEQQKFTLSQVRFYDGFEAAVNRPFSDFSPTAFVKQQDLFFKKGDTFTALGLSKQFKVSKSCIVFFSGNSDVHPFPNQPGTGVQMLSQVQTTVYFRCGYPSGACADPDNPLYCELWFGKQPA